MSERNQQPQTPHTPFFNPTLAASRRMTYTSNSMQPPLGDIYNNNNNNNINNNGMLAQGGFGSANSRSSMSSYLRQSINGGSQPRNSLLSSSLLMPQRPSPMRPLTENDYGGLNSSVMGPPSNRRVSYAMRQSMTGTGGLSVWSTSGVRDTRPVKDKTFQRNTVHALINYLTQAGFPHPVSVRTISESKGFQDVFKFLYIKIEPGFEFQKKFEEEVPILLKTMRYPAADSISRTTLHTVGTQHSRPSLLALLGWMVDLIAIVEKFEELIEDYKMGNSVHPQSKDIDAQMDLTQVTSQQVLYHYLSRSYRTWMLTGEHDPELEETMARSFERLQEVMETDVMKLREANDVLAKALEAAKNEESPLVSLEQTQQVLKKDIAQFKKAITLATPRIEEARKNNEEDKREIEDQENLATELETAVKETQQVIRTQTITRAGLEAKLEERNGLRRRENGLSQQLADLENQQRTLERRFVDGELEAERVAKEYNALATRVGIVPMTAKYAKGQDYELRLHLENATQASMGGASSSALYSIDIKGQAEQVVSALRNQLNRDANDCNMELSTLHEELEILNDTIADDKSDLHLKEMQYNSLTKKYQEEKENARYEAASRQSFAESEAEQIQAMILEASHNMADSERLDQEYLYMERQAAQNREVMSRRITEIVQQLQGLKQHVEQQVGLIKTMAAKERADTEQQNKQIKSLLQTKSHIDRELLFA
ncbi:kinetochore-associated Ndc80 complex subunit ndc80 [Podila epigama]|nr:kinetochore-associated Ndc80 complex subunit ndc80 [Podila epigama]